MSVLARRLPILALGAVSLMAGVFAGLARAGWDLFSPELGLVHGPLMVSAFFGTVIGLERAVAARRAWGYTAPLACGAGGLMLIAGQDFVGAGLLVLGSVIFVALMAALARKRWDEHLAILALGAVLWAIGNGAWAFGVPVGQVVLAWAGFLVMTIFGERVELGRFGRPMPGKEASALVVAATVAAAALAGLAGPDWAWGAFGATLIFAALWLWRFDIARHTIRRDGLTRYVAWCLLSGYGWLAVAGGWALMGAPAGNAFAQDAVLHALFVGFVFSMVFGHAPIILPAVLGFKHPFSNWAYLALAGLNASLVLRLAGDGLADWDLRMLGAALNAATLAGWILFTLVLVTGLLRRP